LDIGTAYWLDIGTPAKYLQANFDVLTGTMKAGIPGEATAPDCWIGSKSSLSELAWVSGPVAMGRECTVSVGATIGPRVVLGDRVRIAENASVQESVIWSGATVGSGAIVTGAIIGRNCQVMPGANVVPGTTAEDGTVIQ
jgi:mannose-1-phosphate guanylyltransferase